jgi:hypothetical protein
VEPPENSVYNPVQVLRPSSKDVGQVALNQMTTIPLALTPVVQRASTSLAPGVRPVALALAPHYQLNTPEQYKKNPLGPEQIY